MKRGEGEVTVIPPEGISVMTRTQQVEAAETIAAMPAEAGPFNPRASLGYLPVGGQIAYRLDPEWISLDKSWAATTKTHVEFEGRTAFGERSRIPFHVTSLDWQESDRVLAGIMTAFGSSTGAIPIGGYGEFDGVMLNAFTKPRIEGVFNGNQMRAWNVVWGQGRADLVIENSYAFVKSAVLRSGSSEILADGQFSLGYPRRDQGEEINARVRLTQRPLRDLRHAFELDDYPVEGLVSGDYHLYGNYETPFGYGRLIIEKGVAYGETFDLAQSSLRFEGTGVRLDALEITKGSGSATGAAWVGWDGNYSFNVDGRRIAVESLATVKVPRAPLSGLLQFNANGTGTFESPRYDVKLRVGDLFAGDEGIGALTARIALRGDLLTADLEAASPRLSVSGSGRLALTPEMDAELSLRFADTSLDPYLRFVQPGLSPFATAVADGTVRVVGELANIDHLLVDTRVERLDLKLFDYPLSCCWTNTRWTSRGCVSSVTARSSNSAAVSLCTKARSTSRRRGTRTSASFRPFSATFEAAAMPHSAHASPVPFLNPSSLETRASRMDASATCLCRTPLKRSTARCPSMPAAFVWTTCRRGSGRERWISEDESG
jgi:hypothetical protein